MAEFVNENRWAALRSKHGIAARSSATAAKRGNNAKPPRQVPESVLSELVDDAVEDALRDRTIRSEWSALSEAQRQHLLTFLIEQARQLVS
jgi:hypothetical protein